jgi:hypothetical protein
MFKNYVNFVKLTKIAKVLKEFRIGKQSFSKISQIFWGSGKKKKIVQNKSLHRCLYKIFSMKYFSMIRIRQNECVLLKCAIIESARLMFFFVQQTNGSWNVFFKSKIQVILLIFWEKKNPPIFFDIKKDGKKKRSISP